MSAGEALQRRKLVEMLNLDNLFLSRKLNVVQLLLLLRQLKGQYQPQRGKRNEGLFQRQAGAAG
jgi:hypothetical protein